MRYKVLLAIILFAIPVVAVAAPTTTIVNYLKVISASSSGIKCLHVDNNGLVSIATSDCGSGGSATTTIFTSATSTGPAFVFASSGNNGLTITPNGNILTWDIPTTTSPTFSSGTFTGNINLSGWLSLKDDSAPPAVLNTIAFYSTSTHGLSRLGALDENGQVYIIGRDSLIIGKNTTGAQINKGQVIMINGATGDVPNFALHAATTSIATMQDVIGLAFENIPINGFGRVLTSGILQGVDTSAFSSGDVLYSSTTAGAVTNQAPPYPYLSEAIGAVNASGVGNGSIIVDLKETHRDEDGEITNSFRIGDQTSAPKYFVFDNGTTSQIRWAGNTSSTFNLPDIGGYNTFAVSSTNPITLNSTGVIGFTNPGFVTATSTAFYPNGTIIPYASTTGVQNTLTFPLVFASTTHVTILANSPLSAVTSNGTTTVSFTGTLDWASTTNVQKTIAFPIPVASTSLSVIQNLTLAGNVLNTNQDIMPTSSPTFASATLSNFSAGSVLYATTGGALAQDNAGFFWNDTRNFLGIGTSTPAQTLTVVGPNTTSTAVRIYAQSVATTTDLRNVSITQPVGIELDVQTTSSFTNIPASPQQAINGEFDIRYSSTTSAGVIPTSFNTFRMLADLNATGNYTGQMVALNGQARNFATGTLGIGIGVSALSISNGNGTTTNAYGVVSSYRAQTASSGITNGYGLVVQSPTLTGFVTKGTGIEINQQKTSANMTTGYGLIVDNATDLSGFGTTTPIHVLDVYGTVGFTNLSTGAGNGALCMSTAGLVSYSAGANCIPSSLRYKENIQPLFGGLSEVMKWKPVSFEYKPGMGNGTGEQVGFIAEDMQKIDPRLVVLNASGTPESVRYENLTAILTKALQEQQVEIDSLKAEVKKLKRAK